MAVFRVFYSVLLLVLCLSWVRGEVGVTEKPCNNSRTTSLSFSIISKKNATGHWIAEVKMGPEITDNQHNGGWQIHVDKNVVDNNGPQPVVQIKATITAPAPIASPGYELFPGHGYYKLHTEGKNWEEAKLDCIKEHAHLAVINSEAESGIMKQLLARYPSLGGPNVAVFIGFHDKDEEGKYVTIFGQSLSDAGFTRWSTIGNQPDNASPGEDCGSVHRNGGLNDYRCDVAAPFICEQELYPPSNVHTYDADHKIVFTDTSSNTTLKPPPHLDIDVRIDDDQQPPKPPEEEPIIIDEVAAQ